MRWSYPTTELVSYQRYKNKAQQMNIVEDQTNTANVCILRFVGTLEGTNLPEGVHETKVMGELNNGTAERQMSEGSSNKRRIRYALDICL